MFPLAVSRAMMICFRRTFFASRCRNPVFTFPLRKAALPTMTWLAPHPAISSARETVRIPPPKRSEEHTSELQSHLNLVCRLLLEKKKNNIRQARYSNVDRASVAQSGGG